MKVIRLLLTVIILCLEVAGLRSVINVAKITLSIVPQPNIKAGKLDETVSGGHLTVLNERPKFCHNCITLV